MSIANPFLKFRIIIGGIFVSYILQSEFVNDYPRSWSSSLPANTVLFASAAMIIFSWSILSYLFAKKRQKTLLIFAFILIVVHLAYVYLASKIYLQFLIPFFMDAILVGLYLPVFRGRSIEFARAATFFLVIVPAVAIMVWSTSTIWFASVSAREAAAGGPFCIALGEGIIPWKGGQYKVATSLRDLQGLVMQAPQQQGNTSWYYFTFNAVEITFSDAKPVYWNWSHWKLRFERIERQDLWGQLAGACKPELDFVNHLTSTFRISSCEGESVHESFEQADGHYDGVGHRPGHREIRR